MTASDAEERQHGDGFGNDPRAVAAGAKGEEEQPRLEGRTFDQQRAPPRHPGRGAFEVVGRREARVVVQVDDAIGVSAAEGDQLDGAEEGLVQTLRQAEVAVHEVVRDRAVGEEGEEHGAGDGGRPEVA